MYETNHTRTIDIYHKASAAVFAKSTQLIHHRKYSFPKLCETNTFLR